MFARTDFRHQKLMVRESVLEMLQYAHAGTGYEQIRKLGDRHRELNVKPEHYDQWRDALCAALAKHDPEFDAPLEQEWRAAMRKGIGVMLAQEA
jgi:hemoglobin-like flavoprotein